MHLICQPVLRLLLMGMYALLLSVGAASAAPQGIDITGASPTPVVLTRYFDVLEDPTRALTLQDVQSPQHASRFQPVPATSTELNYGFNPSAYWMRLHLRNTSNLALDRLLEIHNARLSSIQLHQPQSEPEGQLSVTGAAQPFDTRSYQNRFFVFSVQVPAQSERVIYLRLQSTNPLAVPAKLWEPEAFHAYERNDYLIQALYFGLALGMICFNVLLYTALRDPIYLKYVFFAGSMVLTLAAINGLGHEFLWPGASQWSNMSSYVGFSCCMVSLLVFVRHILDTAKVVPLMDQLIQAQIAFYCVLPLGFALSYETFIRPAPVLYGTTSLFVFALALFRAVKKQRSAYFFLAAFGMLVIGTFMMILKAYKILGSNAITDNGLQIGSALEMILMAFALADRFNEMRREKSTAQHVALESQHRLVSSLKSSERELEVRVAQRTIDLKKAFEEAKQSREQAINAQQQATQALDDLRAAQAQMIQSEKMATLGQIVANVAHEINTPIGAVKSSGRTISDTLDETLQSMPALFRTLDDAHTELFIQLLNRHRGAAHSLSTRQERALVKELTRQLEDIDIDNPRHKASILVQMGSRSLSEDFMPLFRHPESDRILDTAHGISIISNNAENINAAVDKVSKIVFALKSFSHTDASGDMVDVDLIDSLETVLTIYHSQIRQGTELVREYDYLPPLHCVPDEINQVWTNLIHNAIQAIAMQEKQDKPVQPEAYCDTGIFQGYQGKLTIGIRQEGAFAVVSVSDTGPGIPPEIREKIFEPFFTTKPVGVGSGLGLDIVRRIVHKHQGRIDLQTEVGVGTTFSVYLPYLPGH